MQENIKNKNHTIHHTQRKHKAARRKLQRLKKRLLILGILLVILAAVNQRIFLPGNLRLPAVLGMNQERTLKEEGVPQSLIDLYERNKEARQFVLDYEKNKDKHEAIDISKEVRDGEIPLFLQWDERWGYETYGDDYMAVTGCGPTALSMVYTGLTGDTSLNPYEMAKLAQNNGYYVNGSGSSWNMMLGLASQIGLDANEMSLDENSIKKELSAGNPIICIMGPGDFTTSGHFIVLTGITDDGKVQVNDPNSVKNSQKTWELDRIMSQMRDLWVYKA